MPLWGWLFFIAMFVWAVYRLLGAWRTGKIRYGPFEYVRLEEPITFWIFTSADVAILLFSGGALLFLIWKILIST